jgi:DNA-directed RNA polymerase specialized sigma subunit
MDNVLHEKKLKQQQLQNKNNNLEEKWKQIITLYYIVV